MVCPATTAYALKKVWPEIELVIIPDAGHSSREVGIEKALVEVCIIPFFQLLTSHSYCSCIKATNKFADY